MNSLNLNTTEQVLVCIFIFLALGSLLYRFTIVPELRYVRAARFQFDFQQDLQDAKMATTQYRDALSNKVKGLEVEIAQAKLSLFSRDEARDFQRSLSQLVNQTGSVLMTMIPYNMQDLSPAGAVDQRPGERQQTAGVENSMSIMTMPVSIAISGDYGAVVRFLEELQEYRQLMTISELKIATARDPSQVDAELMLKLYVYEDQEV